MKDRATTNNRELADSELETVSGGMNIGFVQALVSQQAAESAQNATEDDAESSSAQRKSETQKKKKAVQDQANSHQNPFNWFGLFN